MILKLIIAFSLTSTVFANICTDLDIDSGHKINFCHVPGGGEKEHTLCTDISGAITHLGLGLGVRDPNNHSHVHHDYLGICESELKADELWLCDAGIRHLPHNVEVENCIGDSCTSLGDINYISESVEFFIADYFDADTIGNFSSSYVRASDNLAYGRASSKLGDHALSDVKFTLNSERLGSEYRVDTCWRNKLGNDLPVEFNVRNQLVSSTGPDYLNYSKLERRTEIKCSYENSFEELFELSHHDYVRETGFSSYNPGAFPDTDITNCVISQFFRETRESGGLHRPNSLSRIAINSSVSTNVEVLENNDGKIRFCHAELIEKKSYICKSYEMNNSELRYYLYNYQNGLKNEYSKGFCKDNVQTATKPKDCHK